MPFFPKGEADSMQPPAPIQVDQKLSLHQAAANECLHVGTKEQL